MNDNRFHVRSLTPDEIRTVYAERMTEDFRADELKPLKTIEDALAKRRYLCMGAEGADGLLAYAYFVRVERDGGALYLVDYFAVRRDVRDTGVGGAFLRALCGGVLRDADCALLEVEDPDAAPDAPERAHRERRLRFYLRNGLAPLGVTALVFGVQYRILALPVAPLPDPKETREIFLSLYRAILPEGYFRENVFILLGDGEKWNG